MAQANVAPPEPLNFNKPEEWSKWIKRFERYLTVANITDEEQKINSLLYAMGPKSEDIILMFGLTDEQVKVYQTVKDNFDKHFVVRKNVTFERARFNRRIQAPNESIESFLTDLYSLVESCEYGDMRDELLRDKIVVGIRDTKLSETLQMDDKLTLQKALAKVRSKEMIEKQTQALQDLNVSRADVLKHKTQRKAPGPKARGPKSQTPKTTKECYRCANPAHKYTDCPARNSKCGKCGKIGHWAKCCKTKPKNIHEVECTADEERDEYFFGMVESSQVSSIDCNKWNIELYVNGTPVEFKIDSGADITLIGKKDFDKISTSELVKPDILLMGANNQPLNALGMFQCVLENKNKMKSTQVVYVVKDLKMPLLGKPAIESLNILKRTNVVTTDYKEKIKEKFPKLFTGLGTIKGTEYKIKLTENAMPHAIQVPRRISQPMLPKVKKCLDQMVKDGVIRKLDSNEVSEWLAPIVCVPKSNGQIRICTDLIQLNKYIIRPRSNITTVDEILSKVGAYSQSSMQIAVFSVSAGYRVPAADVISDAIW